MKILYIHNKEDWAVHNVGKLWLNDQENVEVDFINYRNIQNISLFKKYDYIWFGYYFIYTRYNYKPSKSILAIHDPMELYPETSNWKEKGIFPDRLKILRELPNIISISEEMQKLLSDLHVNTTLIHTTSLLPLRDIDDVKTSQCRAHSVFQTYPRKNPELMEEIKKEVNNTGIKFDTKIGLDILSEDKYIELLDNHEIYICTSYQEGGPLPAMDAMRRGSIVLTTPVGQIQEIIEDDFNGYICNNKSDFVTRIQELAGDKDKLHKMRVSAVSSIQSERNEVEIKQKVNIFLNKL